MKKTLLYLLLAFTTVACGARSAKSSATVATPAEPKQYGYTIKNSYPHATDSYTQGLLFHEGVLWEGTGQKGASRLLKVDLETGLSKRVAHLPRHEFGEGIAIVGSELFQLTWMENTAHVYDLVSQKEVRTLRYPGEGWGLTSHEGKLYLSDGSATIRVVDPATFKRERSITVTLKGEPVDFLNELEWIEGRIWANVYTTELIVIIDPATGVVEGVVNLEGLLPEEERTPQTDVLNGIAYDATTGRIFVTGKNWSKLYEIELKEQ